MKHYWYVHYTFRTKLGHGDGSQTMETEAPWFPIGAALKVVRAQMAKRGVDTESVVITGWQPITVQQNDEFGTALTPEEGKQ